MKRFLLPLGMSIFLLTACATTPKKPLTFDQLGTFNTYPLNAQTYRIAFEARPNMSFGSAEEITLVKAAQTTVQKGFRLFKVLDDPSNRNQQPPRQAVVYSAPTFSPYGYGYGYGYGSRRHYPAFWSDPFYDLPQVVNLDPIQVSYTIELYANQDKAPQDAFDAYLILQSIGQKYGVSSTGQVLIPPSPPASQP
jgi:hypothetical protein